jgi:hypothetical protein
MPIRWYHKLWWRIVLFVLNFDMRFEGPITLEEEKRLEREMRYFWPKLIVISAAILGLYWLNPK